MKHRDLLKRIGIKWRIFGGFAIFTLLILVLLWMFQVVFLDNFYKFIKTNEIRSSAESLVETMNSDDFIDTVNSICQNTQINIMVTNEKGQILYKFFAMPTGIAERFSRVNSPLYLTQVYDVAESQGGTYLERSQHGGPGMGGPQRDGRMAEPETILYARTAVKSDGTKLMFLLTSNISPVTATVNTLRVQLTYITVIMLILALVLAVILARHISQPIVRINQTAGRLAHGDYDVTFEEKGYREVAELAHTMNYAASELSRTETLRRDLIANVSHDLRTPLTMITGYSEVMRDLPGENTPENVQIIIDEATRLTTLVNDMLDLSKLQSGTQTYLRENFNLTQSLRTILLRYSKLTDYNITFSADCDVTVCGDELKISQVFYNLVNNAITYTGPDKVVDIRQIVHDGKVRVEVRDTGEGIPQDKLNDIWDRYYKVDKEHKRAQIGTGLGLSIVKTILDMHGGAYGVSSQEGVGSVFWFELDIVEE
ncbi:ATP-binding protein [Caproiciproducens sp. LBM24188]